MSSFAWWHLIPLGLILSGIGLQARRQHLARQGRLGDAVDPSRTWDAHVEAQELASATFRYPHKDVLWARRFIVIAPVLPCLMLVGPHRSGDLLAVPVFGAVFAAAAAYNYVCMKVFAVRVTPDRLIVRSHDITEHHRFSSVSELLLQDYAVRSGTRRRLVLKDSDGRHLCGIPGDIERFESLVMLIRKHCEPWACRYGYVDVKGRRSGVQDPGSA